MKFNDLDRKMRAFEAADDPSVLPGLSIVVRLDGRSFTKLTKETHPFEAPFDERFRDYMVETTRHLMLAGFQAVYGYTQSDEISLLLSPDDDTFGRRQRKLLSVLSGEASARFSLLLGDVACFDSRLIPLPDRQSIVDYFRWRNEDAHRNALNAHCYWFQRKAGQSAREASDALERMGTSDKNELLFENGINFNDLPDWQKRGIGVFWETYEKEAINPQTGETVMAERRRLASEMHLPMKDGYDRFIERFLAAD